VGASGLPEAWRLELVRRRESVSIIKIVGDVGVESLETLL
jgi:hypothetical protein